MYSNLNNFFLGLRLKQRVSGAAPLAEDSLFLNDQPENIATVNIPFIIQYGHVYNKPAQFIKMQLNDLSLYLLDKPYQLFTLTYNA